MVVTKRAETVVNDDINLIINKSLILISNSNTVLKSSSSDPVIKIQGEAASLTKIKGFIIHLVIVLIF